MTDITVSFCCNDRNGENSGRFCAVEFSCGVPGDAEANLSLDATHLDECDQPTIAFHDSIDVIEVAGTRYDIANYSHRRYVGNMAWDSVRMPIDSARALVEWLRMSKTCDVDSCDMDHPFAKIAGDL